MSNDHELNRRTFLLAASAAAATAACPALAQEYENPLSGPALFADVERYANLGEHRTAGSVDLATSAWLKKELARAGCQADYQPFTTRQFQLEESLLEVGGKVVESFPLWPPQATGPAGLQAPLALAEGEADLTGRIALVSFPEDRRASVFPGSAHFKIIRQAQDKGAVGIIAITQSGNQEIVAQNAIHVSQPWPVPVTLAAAKDEPFLRQAASQGLDARLGITGRWEDRAEALNVIGRLAGKKEGLIVISTPQSGWFACAGERGVGIAILLGLARWLARRENRASYVFVTTSGHELGGLGMNAFMEDGAPPPRQTTAWLHLGAGIATYRWAKRDGRYVKTGQPDPRRYLGCSANLGGVLERAFSGVKGLTLVKGRTIGELSQVKKKGYPTIFGIAAGHFNHHSPTDIPSVTGPELIAPVAAALADSLAEIEEMG